MTVNLQWRDAMTKAGREFTQAEQDAGWPQTMKPAQLAALQRPFSPADKMAHAAAGALYSALGADCVAGLVDHTTTQVRPIVNNMPGHFGRFDGAIVTMLNGRIGFMQPGEVKEATERHITALAFAVWLTAQGETPSAQIQAWFNAVGTAQAAPVVTESVSGGNEPWKKQARARAYEIIKRDKEKDLYPSQVNIADEIAKQFRSDGLMGTDGKPLTGAYIKRWALTGISSAQIKLVSTVIRQSK